MATGKGHEEMRCAGLPADEPIAPTPIVPQNLELQQIPMPEKLTDEERFAFAINRRFCS